MVARGLVTNSNKLNFVLMRYLIVLLVFASCQPVYRHDDKVVTNDTAEIADCENRLQECAESNQQLQDSIYILNNKK